MGTNIVEYQKKKNALSQKKKGRNLKKERVSEKEKIHITVLLTVIKITVLLILIVLLNKENEENGKKLTALIFFLFIEDL